MKIQSTELTLASQREAWQKHHTVMRVATGGGQAAPLREGGPAASISEAGRRLLSATDAMQDAQPAAPRNLPVPDEGSAAAEDAAEGGARLPARLEMLRAIIEALTGRQIRVFGEAGVTPTELAGTDAAPAPDADRAPAWRFALEQRQVREEYEQTVVSASGRVTLEDGRSVAFSLSMQMSRYVREELSVSVQAGAGTDPLVLQLGRGVVSWGGESVAFMLDGDDRPDALPLLSGGAYLALDRDGDGAIGSGRELFGPTRGDGFAELAALDADGNRWIDAADPGFTTLRLWQPTVGGPGRLGSLAEAGVGALSLERVASAFSLRDAAGAEGARVRSTGVYLAEDGRAGALQQIDVTA